MVAVVRMILPSVVYIISPATVLPEGNENKSVFVDVLLGFNVTLITRSIIPSLVHDDNNVVSSIILYVPLLIYCSNP